MSVGRAFHTRGPATETALSTKCGRVRLTTKLHRSLDHSRLSSQRSQSCMRYHESVTMSDVVDQCAQFEVEPKSAQHWKPVDCGAVSEGVAQMFEEVRHREVLQQRCTRCKQLNSFI